MQNLGSALSVNPGLGTRFSNTLRWDSPNWSGFSMTLGYARPTDPAPPNAAQAAAGVSNATIRDGKKNRVWHLAARYETGGFQVRYSYLNDKDANTAGTLAFGGTAAANGVINGTLSAFAGSGAAATSVWKITSNRLGARYRFANGFGIGLIWDNSKFSASHETGPTGLGGTSIKRTAWSLPVTFETGNHKFGGTYSRARDWRGTLLGTSVGGWGYTTTTATFGAVGAVLTPGVATATHTLGGDTGARMWALNYSYKLSQRTNVHVSYQSIRNDALARYDLFANTSGTGAGQFGADPRSVGVGMRHTF
jgi:predicted porin